MKTPKRAAEFLPDVMRQIRIQATHDPLQEALTNVLEPGIRQNCRVAGFRGGRLWLEVDSAPLCAELRSFRRDELLTAINSQLSMRSDAAGKRLRVAEVVFRVGGTGHV